MQLSIFDMHSKERDTLFFRDGSGLILVNVGGITGKRFYLFFPLQNVELFLG